MYKEGLGVDILNKTSSWKVYLQAQKEGGYFQVWTAHIQVYMRYFLLQEEGRLLNFLKFTLPPFRAFLYFPDSPGLSKNLGRE